MGSPSPAPGIGPHGGLRPSDCLPREPGRGRATRASAPDSSILHGTATRGEDGADNRSRRWPAPSPWRGCLRSVFSSGCSGKPGALSSFPGTHHQPSEELLLRGACFALPSHLPRSLPLPSFCDAEIHFQGSEVTACQDVLIPPNLGSSVSQGVSGGPRGKESPLSSRICLICRWWEIPGHSQTSANGFYWATAEVFKGFFNMTLEERGWKGECKTRFALWWSPHPGRGWAFHSVAQEGLLHADGCLALFLPWISFILFKHVRIRWRVTPAPPLPFPSCTAQKSGFLKQAQVFHQVMHP